MNFNEKPKGVDGRIENYTDFTPHGMMKLFNAAPNDVKDLLATVLNTHQSGLPLEYFLENYDIDDEEENRNIASLLKDIVNSNDIKLRKDAMKELVEMVTTVAA